MQQEVEQAATARLGARATAEEEMALNAQLEGQRKLIERLRAVDPTGRIVLNLEPEDQDVSKLMGITLEDGDRFLVPARPAIVNVLGAVYNQNAFLHNPAFRVTDYVNEAGGPMRMADKARTFIIRADGSVIPKHGSSPFSKSFSATRLNPGDSVVVPQALARTGFMRELRDWTQVFSQLALGAAAINVLR
jgi:hypothetical protein